MATIMLVEDNLIYRELLRELCEMDGHEVIEAARAEDALAVLNNFNEVDVYQQQRRNVDLFIVDFNMDGMNGYEFIREVRRMEDMEQIPIVMISSTSKDMQDLLRLEGVAFLQKPCPNSAVMTCVRSLLKAAPPRRNGDAPPANPGVAPKAPLSAPGSLPPRSGGVPPARPPAAMPPAAGRPGGVPPARPPATMPPAAGRPGGAPPARPPAAMPPAAGRPGGAPPARPPAAMPPAAGRPGGAAPVRLNPAPPASKPTTMPPATGRPAGGLSPRNAAAPPPALKPAARPTPSDSPPADPPARLPPLSPPARQTPSASPSVTLGAIDEGIKNRIAQSAQLSEFLAERQKLSDTQQDVNSASSPVADLVEQILDSAIQQHASDIHIEPQETSLEVRVRVDGALQPLIRLPVAIADSLVARIKILCSLNITEKRLPQDGQFAWSDPGGNTTKFRVSTLPSVHGEKIVIRILPSRSLEVRLDSVGFTPEELTTVQKVLRSPNGILLVTGPTGSGKTTTLYTMLESLNSRQRNIVTVEDPVEYQLPGITQVQVNPGIGYTFERVLRSFLRQDPNVMLVGEIRDVETAEIALKAAVTGHIVLSTLHTNDAVGAVHRLLSMGLPAYLVAAASRLVIAQRLVRVLCPQCRVQEDLSPEEACLIDPAEAKIVSRVWRAQGCQACRGMGYVGRRPIIEVLPILSHEIRTAIAKEASPEEIKAIAEKAGMVTMRRKALQYVAEGITSIDEALTALYI